ncbi:DUF7523 family protein [Haloplanus pelagicus]|jgi:hypothetical protein|uniref:DUF7523 family protein n=1 Tax=Haloplanus pelagicus TaxID=2949995 RepID=UPI00203FE4F3|nr:hypothetical protein [Haloplanus sp. HW8-1]
MSIAEATREAVRERPYLLAALRADVVNYRAAAATLGLDASEEAVAAALRRFAADLEERERTARDVRVTVERGVGVVDDANGEPSLTVGDRAVVPDAGSATALVAIGDVDARALWTVLGRLDAAGIEVAAAGVADGRLLVAVGGRDGGRALRVVEAALDATPA